MIAAAKPIGFMQYLQSQLTIPMLEDLARKLVLYVEQHVPGKTGAEKKAYCVKQCLAILEAFDDKIPVLSKWLNFDSPIADFLEEWAVNLLIEYAWALVFGGAA